jgi:hypothetical protein
MLTLEELKERMAREEETVLMEVLEISSEDLVEAFDHRIEARYETLCEDYDDTDSREQ